MRVELKELFNKTCDLFDVVDEKLGIMNKANAKGRLSDIFRYELMSFLMCLSACDGRISRVEAKLIRDYFDLNIFPGHIKELIQEHCIGDSEYYENVPESLRLSVKIDNRFIQDGIKMDKGLSDVVIELFMIFGKEMVVCDEKVKLEEQTIWSRYITMMVQFLYRESLIHKNSTDEISRPGSPIEVKYENSFATIGRVYTLFYGYVK